MSSRKPIFHFCAENRFFDLQLSTKHVSLNVFSGGDGGEFCEKSHMAGGLSSDACARVCFWIAIMMALELSFSLRQKPMKQMADCCFFSSSKTFDS